MEPGRIRRLQRRQPVGNRGCLRHALRLWCERLDSLVRGVCRVDDRLRPAGSNSGTECGGDPGPIRVAFFVLNVTGVSLTAYLLLQYAVRARDEAFARSEGLLLNVLPRTIAERLKRTPGIIAESHPDVTVLFADVVDFTPFTSLTAPERVIGLLDEVFSRFDRLAERHGLEKIKTIGDAYMVAAGVPVARPDHAEVMAAMAIDMLAEFERVREELGLDLAIRIGMESGPVVAGVIGRHKFSYDLWGDTVNTASRMESHGIAGRVQVGVGAYQRLREKFRFEERGEIEVKGKGRLSAYLLISA